MTKIEKRRRFIINTVYFAIILGLFYFFMRFAFWTCFPFILAFFIAMALQRPVNWITKKNPAEKGACFRTCRFACAHGDHGGACTDRRSDCG